MHTATETKNKKLFQQFLPAGEALKRIPFCPVFASGSSGVLITEPVSAGTRLERRFFIAALCCTSCKIKRIFISNMHFET